MGKSKKGKKSKFRTIRRHGLASYKSGSESSQSDPSSSPRCPSFTPEEEHQRRLGQHTKELWTENKITDIEVQLHGVPYRCHKTVLSCYSKYFKKYLLNNDSHEKIFHVKLPRITNEAFEVLLNYMYRAELKLTCQNIGDVYLAAQKLGMDDACDICMQILQGKCRPEVHSVYVYVTAQKLGLKDTENRALEAMCRKFEQIVGTPEFYELNLKQVTKYLSSDVLATRSEVIVLLAALKWISVKFFEREGFAKEVIGCVRFPMMTLDEILACHHPPILPGIMEIVTIKFWLLSATCFAAAKSMNKEKLFQRYACAPRTYLLPRESIILWDPNIFDPDRHEMYSKDIAATKLQAAYRGYRSRKDVTAKDSKAAAATKDSKDVPANKDSKDVPANKDPKDVPAKKDSKDVAATKLQVAYRDYRNKKSMSKVERNRNNSTGETSSDDETMNSSSDHDLQKGDIPSSEEDEQVERNVTSLSFGKSWENYFNKKRSDLQVNQRDSTNGKESLENDVHIHDHDTDFKKVESKKELVADAKKVDVVWLQWLRNQQ